MTARAPLRPLIALATLIALASPAFAAGTTPPAGRGSAAKAKPAPATDHPSGGAPRTLESIHIKGEIAVPQVLFITARDQRRFMDFQHRHYLRTSREVGERTAFPSRIALTGNRPDDERKEKRP